MQKCGNLMENELELKQKAHGKWGSFLPHPESNQDSGAASHPEGLRQGNTSQPSLPIPTSLNGAGRYPGAECRPADLISTGNTDVVLCHGLQLLDVKHVGRHRGVEGPKGDVASWNNFLDLELENQSTNRD